MPQYISPDKLKIDELVEQAVDIDTMTIYYDAIDREIVMQCEKNGVLKADIPVDDGTGYVTSAFLESVGVYFGLWQICLGYNGSGGHMEDVYSRKANAYWTLYQSAVMGLTEETIKGGDGETEIPPNSYTNTVQCEY